MDVLDLAWVALVKQVLGPLVLPHIRRTIAICCRAWQLWVAALSMPQAKQALALLI